MRFARFITSGGEERAIMTGEDRPSGGIGVVLAGIPAGDRATIERYAEHGYDVLVANVDPAAEVADGLAAVRAAMEALASRTELVTVVGYGFGGEYAFLAVTRLGAAAAGALRGAGIGRHLDESARVKKPLSFHFADDDEAVPFTEVRAIKGALEGFGTTEIYRYPALDADAILQAERRVFAVLDGLR
jgi:dienelactone hydrolase